MRISERMQAALREHNPYLAQSRRYAAWHIRTADGETDRSFDPAIHKHVLTSSSSVICPAYADAMVLADQKCGRLQGMPIYIASTR